MGISLIPNDTFTDHNSQIPQHRDRMTLLKGAVCIYVPFVRCCTSLRVGCNAFIPLVSVFQSLRI